MSMLSRALAFGAINWKIFPIKPGCKNPPLVKWGTQSTSDADTITAMWTRTPHANIGLACGQSGIAVVDVDTKEGKRGKLTLDNLDVLLGHKLSKTRMQRTPSGGLQYFYADPLGQIPTTQNIIGKELWDDGVSHLDTRGVGGAGGYVLLPQSVTQRDIKSHTYSGAYEWINGWDHPIAMVDQWLIDVFAKSMEAKRDTEIGRDAAPLVDLDKPDNIAWAIHYLNTDALEAIEGSMGDQTTLKTAMMLRGRAISREKCFELMLEHYNEWCAPPWENEELQRKVDNAYDYAHLEQPGETTPEVEFDDFVDDDKKRWIDASAKYNADKAVRDAVQDTNTGETVTKPDPVAQQTRRKEHITRDWVWVSGAKRFVRRVDGLMWDAMQFDSNYNWLVVKASVSKAIFKSKDAIMRFDKLAFRPGHAEFLGTDYYNTWRQSKVVPVAGDTALWDEHINYLFQNADDAKHDWHREHQAAKELVA